MREVAPGVFEGGAPAPMPSPLIAVTRRQALRALLEAGLLDGIEAAIAAMPEPQQSRARIDWESAAEFRRDFPLLLTLASVLGLSEADVDALFATAATF